ncbi:MAG: fatty acid desaturase [Burkholderiales bacterium]|nr:fatty acid desaturase [Burkholderiales bacterium]
MADSIFRSPHGAVPNTLALSYTVGGYAVGVWLLTVGPWYLNLLGVLLTGHALVYAAYYIHEFAHQSIFRKADANNRWGAFMGWLTGSCYAPFAALRRKHMRHHIDRADVLTFDYRAFLRRHPALEKLTMALEWAYVPAVEFIMHAYVIVLPFIKPERAGDRPRIVATLAVRAAAFAALGWYSPKAVILYLVSYMIMLHALRFTDAYQHTYDAYAVLEDGGAIPDDKVRDRTYEQANTYTNLVSVAHPAFNLLLLNFSYHNAHHERPIVPWHDLPKLHASLYGTDLRPYVQLLPMTELLRGYHRDRVKRVTSDDYGSVGTGTNKADHFLGAYGVSFLTAV